MIPPLVQHPSAVARYLRPAACFGLLVMATAVAAQLLARFVVLPMLARADALVDANLAKALAQPVHFRLAEITLAAAKADGSGEPAKIMLQNASADFSQAGWDVRGAIDGNPGTGWAVSPEFGKPHPAVFETAEGSATEAGGTSATTSGGSIGAAGAGSGCASAC